MPTTRVVGAALLAFASMVGLVRAQEVTLEQTAYIKSHAIPFTTAEAGHGFDDLKPLQAVVGDARIVSLGEPTHGTREAFQMKHRLLEYLVSEMGFSIFSIEANMPEAYALNDYIQGGKGDPKALIAGMYFWTWNTEEVLAMVEWMRGWNAKHAGEPGRKPLQFTGFDMQTPTVAWKQAETFLLQHAPELAAANKDLGEQVLAVQQQGFTGEASGWTSATGAFPAAAAKGKKLTLSCWIRTEGVTGWAGAWWRCDTPAGVNGFNNMQDQNITGDTPWTRHDFTIDIPKDTENINFGFILSGEGTALLDDIEIRLDGEKYADDKAFSLDFENDAVRFLSCISRDYEMSRVETSPHGGKKCLQLKHKPAPAAKVDGAAVAAKAAELLKAMTQRRGELAGRSSARDADWAIQNARVVSQCAAMTISENSFGARDEAMAANVRWILDQNPGQKIVLWAHNGHVAKAEVMGMKSMGLHLKAAFADKMVVFGFTTGRGAYTAIGGADYKLKHDNDLKPGPEGSVETLFTAAELPAFIIDIRQAAPSDPGSSWAASRRPVRSIGAMAMEQQFFPVIPNESFDLLVWQAETTASVPITRKPAEAKPEATPVEAK